MSAGLILEFSIMVYLINAAEVKKCSMDSEMACNTLLGVNGIRKIWHEKKMRGRRVTEDMAKPLVEAAHNSSSPA